MSKALTALAALTTLSDSAQQATDSSEALDRLEPEDGARTAPDSEDGRATFDKGEAIALGVLTSFFAGPAVGIAVGTAYGIAKRKADQGILDQMATEDNAFTKSYELLNDDVDARIATAKADGNIEDIATLGTIRTGLELSRRGFLSGHPETRASAAGMLNETQNELLDFSRTNETQRITAETLAESQRIELGNKRDNKVTALKSAYDAASADYIKRTEAGNRAINALDSGSNTDIHTAVISYFKSIEPTSAVLGNEFEMLSNQGSEFEQAYSWVNSAWNGEPMTEAQRRELGATILANQNESIKFQEARELDYSNQLFDAEIPDRYHDQFRTVQNLPPTPELFIPQSIPEKLVELDKIARDNQSMHIGDAADAFFQGLEDTQLSITDRLEATDKFFTEFSRAVQGGPRGGPSTPALPTN